MKEITKILKILEKKILILDGAMGTMIQKNKLNEADFKGEKLKSFKKNLLGNNDILNITNSDIVYEIHKSYLDSGADIIQTNTFNSTKTSQQDYDCESLSYDLNFYGGQIAKKAIDDFLKKNPDEFKLVAGVLGPTNRTCSMSPDVNNPSFRNINFDQLKEDYETSTQALIASGVDVIMIETIFDTLNAKAALMAIRNTEKIIKKKIPVMISATITDLSGRTLSGQTLEGFYNSIIHSNPISVGLNCALGPKELEPHLIELDRISECFISIHPNAGLPNAFGNYDETPESMAKYVKNWADNCYINIVGGCCGTTPEHITAMKLETIKKSPRKCLTFDKKLRLSGLEAFNF
tara:strand:- start:678 stop:1727 length:1050 start_codon:yes stop_codon:yes gene_type:complete